MPCSVETRTNHVKRELSTGAFVTANEEVSHQEDCRTACGCARCKPCATSRKGKKQGLLEPPSFPSLNNHPSKVKSPPNPEAAFTHCEQNTSRMSKRTSANASNGSAKELTVGEPGMYLSQELQSAVSDLLQLSTSRRSCSLMTTLISP